MIITAFNPSTDGLEKTYLTNPYNIGINTVEVKNNQEIVNNTRLLLGEMGLSQSEIVTAGTPNANGTTLPVGSTLFSHPANTPVYALMFDQVKFYRSTTGSSGTYSLLATVNLDVTSSDLQTTYNDLTAAAGYYYKVTMFNSVSLVESALSDPIPGITGWSTNQVGYVIEQVYKEIDDPTESLMPRDEMLGYFNDVNDELTMQVARPYRFLYTRSVLPRVAAANTINYPTDSSGNQLMWKFDRLDYNYVNNTTTPVTNNSYTLEIVPIEYFRNRYISNENDSTTQSDEAQVAAFNDATKQIVYYPPSSTSSGSVFYLYYWGYFTRISSESQVFQTYTPHIYKLYVLWKFYRKRSIAEPAYLQQADRYASDYNIEKAKYKQHDRIDSGTPRRFTKGDWVNRSYRR